MSDYGIFSDEGLLEGEFATFTAAKLVLDARYFDDDAHVAECCHDHPEHERTTCEECNADDDELGQDEDE